MSADGPIMFSFWILNRATGEAAQIDGQGSDLPSAFKDAWENANEDYGKSSSGAPPISRAHLIVQLPKDGRAVRRAPKDFASRKPYNAITEAKQFADP